MVTVPGSPNGLLGPLGRAGLARYPLDTITSFPSLSASLVLSPSRSAQEDRRDRPRRRRRRRRQIDSQPQGWLHARKPSVSVMNKDNIHHKETHGTSSDITRETPVDKVKGPNLFERAKEEVEALVGAVHNKMEHNSSPHEKNEHHKDFKDGNEASMHKIKTHKNETHGTSDDINEDTPIEKVKGPNVFERAKEEIEAIVESFHPKKGSDDK